LTTYEVVGVVVVVATMLDGGFDELGAVAAGCDR